MLSPKSRVEAIIEIRYSLRSLGISVIAPTLLFGDNNGVIQNCTLSESQLQKKHVAISYHKVRECVAAGMIQPIKIAGEENFADLLTKALTPQTFRYLVSGLLFGGTRAQHLNQGE